MQKRKVGRPRKSAWIMDDTSSGSEEEEIPKDFGDTSASDNSSSDNSDSDEFGSNHFGGKHPQKTSQPKPEKEIPLIQEIVGIKENESDLDNANVVYYVKWTGKSYIHCSYLPKDEVMNISGGAAAIKRYNNKTKKNGISQSLSIPNLMTVGSMEISANWFEVDRVIAQDGDKYLVKWKSLDYEESTWEDRNDIPNNNALKKFEMRKERPLNSTRIEDNKRNVDPKSFVELSDPLKDSDGNTMRDYQLEGFNWLRYCWFNKNNSILADEMGLGKTLQIVSLLNDISTNHNIHGPFLILAPLSTLPHWKNEFERWTDINAIIYHGSAAGKEIIKKYEMFITNENGQFDTSYVHFDVLITNYETFRTDFDLFSKIEWHYLVLDEGHRLKNHTGKVYKLLQQIKYEHCTLLTGTPVQNNVEELWSLLHFLHPERFSDLAQFMEKFGVIQDHETLTQIQAVIKPYILRRRKADVDTSIAAKEETIIEVELTRIQKTYYKALLHENAGTLLQQITGGALPSLLNLMMQLRKVCNHPFLIKGAPAAIEEQVAKNLQKSVNDEEVLLRSLVDSSGKLILIDKLLPKLRNGGHKVLIFSQMVKVLDILEEYLALINIKPERIDGSVPENERQNAIERFATDPNAFVFLLCTRAGGVGINLTAADTVIIYDSDWNPQNDLQAESRCHRIGQKSKVKVYRLVTRGTYELEMLDRASKKLGLDHAILDGGEIAKNNPMAAKEIEKLLRSGVYRITEDDDEIDKFCSADIDQILDSRSKSFTTDISSGANSKFSKVSFTNENGNDNEEINSTEFWASVLPSMTQDNGNGLTERRCRQKPRKFSDDDDENENSNEKESKKKKRTYTGVPTPRGIAAKIMHQGYNGTAIEKALILHAANEAQLAPEDIEILKQILGVSSLEERTDEIIKAEKRFSPPLDEFTDKTETLLKRTFFFYQLNQVLTLLQEPDISAWPQTESGANPLVDYAIIYGICKNGLGQFKNVMENVTVNATLPSQIGDKAIQRIGRTIIAAFILDAQNIDTFPKKYMEPNEWYDAHQSLFNRSAMTNEELQNLFQTLALTGIIYKSEKSKTDFNKIIENYRNEQSKSNENNQGTKNPSNDDTKVKHEKAESSEKNSSSESNEKEKHDVTDENSVDWDTLRKYACLDCVSVECVSQEGEDLLKLVRDELSKEEAEPILERLGNYGNKIWISRCKSTIRDIAKIRIFAKSITEEKEKKTSKMRTWDSAPNWWSTEHDIALVNALSEFGLIFVSSWLIDPDRPFLQHLPANSIDDFVKAAETENIKFRPQRPRDAGDLSYLYNDKNRLLRANAIIQYVDSRIDKKRKTETVKYTEDDNDEINETSSLTELPQVPFELGPQTIVLSLGKFLNIDDIHPVGYRIKRQYFSLKNPTEKSFYEAWTEINDQGEMKYCIKHLTEPKMVFEHHKSSGAWEQVIRELQEVKGRLGMQKRKFVSVSGPSMFGFSNPLIEDCFKLMRSQL